MCEFHQKYVGYYLSDQKSILHSLGNDY